MTARLALIGAVLLAGCGADVPPRDAAAAPPVAPADSAGALVTVETVVAAAPLSFPGQLYVEHDAVVLARADGLVEAIGADLGSRVAAGQLLARLESADQEIALARAREAAENAGRIAARHRELAQVGGATAAELEAVESELRRADIEVRQAERAMALTRVVAPFAGVVTARMARPRRLVAAGDSLFRITATAPLLVAVRVPERSSDGVRVGATAQVTGVGGRKAEARVARASPAIDPASGTREFVLRLDRPGALVPGASVTVALGAERRQVLSIPRGAVVDNGYALVWADGRTSLRPIGLGAALDGGRVEVLSGLAAGDTVVQQAP